MPYGTTDRLGVGRLPLAPQEASRADPGHLSSSVALLEHSLGSFLFGSFCCCFSPCPLSFLGCLLAGLQGESMDLRVTGLCGGRAHLMTRMLCVEFYFGSRYPETPHPSPSPCPVLPIRPALALIPGILRMSALQSSSLQAHHHLPTTICRESRRLHTPQLHPGPSIPQEAWRPQPRPTLPSPPAPWALFCSAHLARSPAL